MGIPDWLINDPRVRHVHHRDPSSGSPADFPDWVAPAVIDAVGRLGVTRPWLHQVRAAEAAYAGRHVALGTGTASGKTLAYLLPILAATADPLAKGDRPGSSHVSLQRGGTALYVSPTKALAHDQWRVCRALELPTWRIGVLDGDSDPVERRFARDFASFVLTNPDMLHKSVLPHHVRWSRLLGSLRYVVLDEAHHYRGVFGSHVAAVLRRLRRLAAHYGADPVVVAASATVGEPGGLLARLAGVKEVVEFTQSDAARPALDYVVWQPTDCADREAAHLMARFVADGRQTLTFTSSRAQAELVARRAQELTGTGADSRIAAYRAGYLAEDRRTLEAGLRDGSLRGVACTTALELGVDVAGLDAVITCGFPGTMSALWQQAGRAGRRGRDAVAVLIAREDPLDAYWCSHPNVLFDRPVEKVVVSLDNPYVVGRHLAAAAQELPATTADERYFGQATIPTLGRLETQGALRRRHTGWYWTHPERAVDAIDLRSSSGRSVDIIEADTGKVVGHVDPGSADRAVHQGAVHLHQGQQWLVLAYDPESAEALVRRCHLGYLTQALTETEIRILASETRTSAGAAAVSLGWVELTTQVTGFLRIDEPTGSVWDRTPLDLPRRSARTRAVWWTLDADRLEAAGMAVDQWSAGAHALEHACLALLPVFAPSHRWDVGGFSAAHHPDTGAVTVIVHDGAPGGSGFADQAFADFDDWMAATAEVLQTCACTRGCPRCVISAACERGNQRLDRAAAARLAALIVPPLHR